jgi:hypothetical protein
VVAGGSWEKGAGTSRSVLGTSPVCEPEAKRCSALPLRCASEEVVQQCMRSFVKLRGRTASVGRPP